MTEHAITAPGLPGVTVIETSLQPKAPALASAAPAFVSDTAGMSPSQVAAMRYVDSNRAAAARDLGNQALHKAMAQAADHALNGGPQPSFIVVDPNAAPEAVGSKSAAMDPDSVPEFAHLAEAMRPEELAHYRTAGVNLGLHPAVSETMAMLAGDFKIPRAVANDLQTVAVKHFGGPEALESIPVLDDAGLAELQAAAVAKYGEDAISDLSAQARQVLADKGLLQQFDDLGLTRSSLAFDRRALRALIYWGKMNGK